MSSDMRLLHSNKHLGQVSTFYLSICISALPQAEWMYVQHPVGINWIQLTRCSSQTKMASAGTFHWLGCRRGSCPCPCPSPCFRVCAYACVCACASSFSSYAHDGGGDGGGHARCRVWRSERQPLLKRTALAWPAWRAWTVRLMAALYLKRNEGRSIETCSQNWSLVVIFVIFRRP